MSKIISELPAFSYVDFQSTDCVEVSDMSEMKSKHTTLKDISDFIKNKSNGGFNGPASEANGFYTLDDFTWKDAGVWRFDGDCPEIGIDKSSGALVEIVTYSNPSVGDVHSTASQIPTRILQRVTYGPSVYHRFKDQNGWSKFYRLSNVNGNIIDSGTVEVTMGAYTTTGTVKFTDNIFAGYATADNGAYPSVVISIEDDNETEPYIYMANVCYVGWDGFDYDISSVKYSETELPSIVSRVYNRELKREAHEEHETISSIASISGAWGGSSRTIKLHYIATLEIV